MTDPLLYAGVGLAGAIGAPARFLVDTLVQTRSEGDFPRGTLVINVTGSAVLGFITGLALYHAFPHTPQVLLGTGFCGAYTTFSAFAFESVRLVEKRERAAAFVNIAATLVGSGAAAGLGLALASLV